MIGIINEIMSCLLISWVYHPTIKWFHKAIETSTVWEVLIKNEMPKMNYKSFNSIIQIVYCFYQSKSHLDYLSLLSWVRAKLGDYRKCTNANWCVRCWCYMNALFSIPFLKFQVRLYKGFKKYPVWRRITKHVSLT